MTKQTSEAYVFEKEFVRNVIIIAFEEGQRHKGRVSKSTLNIYADDKLDDMIRDQEPVNNGEMTDDQAIKFIADFRSYKFPNGDKPFKFGHLLTGENHVINGVKLAMKGKI